jgi:surfeit locus 1 family protein
VPVRLSRAKWVVLLAAIVGVAATARLGVWQLDRAAQKNALQAALDERRALPALDTRSLAREPAEAAWQHHRRIVLPGRWLAEATVYLENRQMQGRPGFFVVTPLLLDDGTAVLVQRGWQPRDLIDRTKVVPPPTPAEAVEVAGRIAPPPARLYEFDGVDTGPLRQNLDIDAFGREWRLKLRPLSVLQEACAAPPDGLLRDWLPPATGVHKHYGYAFQWFALAALILGLYVWFQIIRPRRRL